MLAIGVGKSLTGRATYKQYPLYLRYLSALHNQWFLHQNIIVQLLWNCVCMFSLHWDCFRPAATIFILFVCLKPRLSPSGSGKKINYRIFHSIPPMIPNLGHNQFPGLHKSSLLVFWFWNWADFFPDSQRFTVAKETPSSFAKSCWLSRHLCRMDFISLLKLIQYLYNINIAII